LIADQNVIQPNPTLPWWGQLHQGREKSNNERNRYYLTDPKPTINITVERNTKGYNYTGLSWVPHPLMKQSPG